MALTWSLQNVKDHDNFCWIDVPDDYQSGFFDSVYVTDDGKKRRLDYVTTTLIWSTMIIGVSEITKKNVDHFYSRLRLWEKVSGAFLIDKEGKPCLIEYEDVEKHIGLSTNATSVSNLKFLAKLKEVVMAKKAES
jgi:hypothetical protein